MPLLALFLTGCGPSPDPIAPAERYRLLAADGQTLAQTDADHHCVEDLLSGLTWEVKRPGAGLHDPEQRFSWYSTDPRLNMGEPGLADAGHCDGGRCDTSGLIAAANVSALCGQRDWRLPTREELLTLIDREARSSQARVDPAYFPATPAVEYWTASTFSMYPQSAWAIDFGSGLDRADYKSEAKAARLVRGRYKLSPERGDRQ